MSDETNTTTSCPTAAALLMVEKLNRAKARTIRDQREAARFGDLALEAQRQRHRHEAQCSLCSQMEAAA